MSRHIHHVLSGLRVAATALCLLGAASGTHAMEVLNDIEYARVGDRSLTLDLYLPDGVEQPPLVLWIHGGAWRAGSKASPAPLGIVDEGFALASIDFRNSPEAPFPAQVHDIKAAIRFLRAEAADHGVDPAFFALWGHSSGGHLAALAGTARADPTLEGDVGGHAGVDSSVQAILDYSGPANLLTILTLSTPHGLSVREPALELLFGLPPADPAAQEALRLASPVFHVGPDSPPLLLMHGIQDNQVPINQALELEAAYRRAERPVEAQWLPEAGHGLGEAFQGPLLQRAAEFMRRHGAGPRSPAF